MDSHESWDQGTDSIGKGPAGATSTSSEIGRDKICDDVEVVPTIEGGRSSAFG
jgi:hypothetical protein